MPKFYNFQKTKWLYVYFYIYRTIYIFNYITIYIIKYLYIYLFKYITNFYLF